jgi:hypothetical protein
MRGSIRLTRGTATESAQNGIAGKTIRKEIIVGY